MKNKINVIKYLKKRKEYILVKKGLKPMIFIQISKKNKDYKNLILNKLTNNMYYFVEEWGSSLLNIIILNENSLKKIMPLLNKIQKVKFNTLSLIKLIHCRYCFREKTRLLTKKEKQNYQLIEGLCFGYPISCVKEFIKEMNSESLRKDRIVYKVSKHIFFIGYPEYHEECSNLVSFWKKGLT